MPVLTFDDTPKRFILPSTINKSEQAWVEMPTYPICAVDYPRYYDAFFAWREAFKTNPGLKEPILNYYILAGRIADWNYSDATGAKLAIDPANVGHLTVEDVAFLMMKIEDEAVEVLTSEKKEILPATSLPSTTAPQ